MRYKKVAIKVGSNVVTDGDGRPNAGFLSSLTAQVAGLRATGVDVILVSSGAVAAGRALFPTTSKLDTVSQRQVYAAMGQPLLMQLYADLFGKQGLPCAQVLVTKEDFRSRQHYLNMKNCFESLLQEGVVPIVNENDVVAVTELMFTDNDELSGLVAAMLNADALFVLTNVEGVYNGPPVQKGSRIIPEIRQATDFEQGVTAAKSAYGRGGMLTKCHNALKVAALGIAVHIAFGKKAGVLQSLMDPNPPGTYFPPQPAPSNIKKWVAHASNFTKGKALINPGALAALHAPRATSLLLVGVIQLEGKFEKGDVIAIADEHGQTMGYGIAAYGSEEALPHLGQQNLKPLVHYDYLYLEEGK